MFAVWFACLLDGIVICLFGGFRAGRVWARRILAILQIGRAGKGLSGCKEQCHAQNQKQKNAIFFHFSSKQLWFIYDGQYEGSLIPIVIAGNDLDQIWSFIEGHCGFELPVIADNEDLVIDTDDSPGESRSDDIRLRRVDHGFILRRKDLKPESSRRFRRGDESWGRLDIRGWDNFLRPGGGRGGGARGDRYRAVRVRSGC